MYCNRAHNHLALFTLTYFEFGILYNCRTCVISVNFIHISDWFHSAVFIDSWFTDAGHVVTFAAIL